MTLLMTSRGMHWRQALLKRYRVRRRQGPSFVPRLLLLSRWPSVQHYFPLSAGHQWADVACGKTSSVKIGALMSSAFNRWRVSKADPLKVSKYVRALLTSEPPPISLYADGDLSDGAHRLAAAILSGRTSILVVKHPVREKMNDMTWRAWPRMAVVAPTAEQSLRKPRSWFDSSPQLQH